MPHRRLPAAVPTAQVRGVSSTESVAQLIRLRATAMIRRDIDMPPGEPSWALISQVDHARISFELAEHWCEDQLWGHRVLANDDTLREALSAIAHHDDGWTEWEQFPGIDPEHHRPLSFTETPLDDSLAIWSESVHRAEKIGPLAAWMVAGHFAALLSSDLTAPEARQWVDLMQKRRDAWQREWTTRTDAPVTTEVGEVQTASERRRSWLLTE